MNLQVWHLIVAILFFLITQGMVLGGILFKVGMWVSRVRGDLNLTNNKIEQTNTLLTATHTLQVSFLQRQIDAIVSAKTKTEE